MMASVIGLGTVEMRAICHRVLVDVVRGYVQTEAGTRCCHCCGSQHAFFLSLGRALT